MVWEYLTVAASMFAVGFALGFYLGSNFRHLVQGASGPQVLLGIAAFVALIWGISVVSGIYTSHEPSKFTHGTMGAVAGYAFKEYRRRREVEDGV